MEKFLTKFSLSLMAIVLCISLSGCGKTNPTGTTGNSALVSKSGIKLETFIPDTASIIFKLGSNDENQRKNMEQLMQNFPQDGMKNITKQIAEGFDSSFKAKDITFEKDLSPALGKNLNFMFGVEFAAENSAESNSDEKREPIGSPITAKPPFNVFLIIALDDSEKFDTILKKAVEMNELTKETYKSFDIYKGSNALFMGRHQDVAVMASSMKSLQASLDNVESGKNSLLSNSEYQKIIAKAGNSISFFYADVPMLIKNIKNMAAYETGFTKILDQTDSMGMIEGLKSEAIALSAESNGLRMHGLYYYDEQKLKESGFDMGELYHESYLYKKIPGEDMIFYVEGYNLKKYGEKLFKAYSEIEGFKEQLAMFSKQAQALLKMQGLDLEKDILSFMDKGYALAIQNSSNLIPNFALYLDAASNPDGAKKTMGKVYEAINELLATPALKQNGFSLLLTNTPDNAGTTGYVLKLNLDKLPENANVPPFLKNTPIEFYYGVKNDGLAYFAFYPKFTTANGKIFADNENLKKGMAQIKGYDQNMVYMNMESMLGYIDSLFQLASLGGVPMDEDGLKQYEVVKSYFEPVKSLVLSSGKPSNGLLEFQGFIEIKK